MTAFVFIIEIIGTIAFAVSGATMGIRKSMDIFGVCTLGLLTACGGGLTRDIILGKLPPMMFCNSVYSVTALITSAIVFLAVRINTISDSTLMDRILLLADSIGLAGFTVVAVQVVNAEGYGNNFFFVLFLSVITSCGGGLIRDIIASEEPYIFVKHVYATASILGGCVCFALWKIMGQTAAMSIGGVVTLVIRLLAAKFHWSLPKARKRKEH